MLDRIRAIATKLSPRLIEIRRHLHSQPELSGQEYQTAAYVAGVLSSFGYKPQELVGKTGVVADLPGQNLDQGALAIRTDMDALPIRELSDSALCLPKAGGDACLRPRCAHHGGAGHGDDAWRSWISPYLGRYAVCLSAR
jgi:metal-dependent amidase/aminoacylase/carboxypeptidase family protein